MFENLDELGLRERIEISMYDQGDTLFKGVIIRWTDPPSGETTIVEEYGPTVTYLLAKLDKAYSLL